MSARSWRERIEDILDSITEIQSFTRGMDFEAFRNDPRTVKSVALDFIIIGEAASHVPEEIVQAHPEIPWSLMKAIRNRLVHVYFSVDPQIIWDTVQNDLPPLIEPLRKILKEDPGP